MQKIIKIIIALSFTIIISACSSTAEKAVKKQSEPDLISAANINVDLAVGYMERKDYQAARGKLEKAIKQDPESVAAFKTLAYLYASLGLEDEARPMYAKATELKPDDSDLANSYGAFLCSLGEWQEAQKKFSMAYNNPFYTSIYLAESNAGSCYVEAKEFKKAEPLLRKSLRVQPKHPGSLISMAEIGVATERYLMARAYIQRYHAERPATADSLWIQIQAEKALGATEHYMKYARQLIKDFPDSDEAGWVEAQARNEQLR